MSRLLAETDDWLELVDYLHRDPDSFSSWEMDKDDNLKYPQIVQDAEHYALYEVKVRYRINKKTGEVEYLSLLPD